MPMARSRPCARMITRVTFASAAVATCSIVASRFGISPVYCRARSTFDVGRQVDVRPCAMERILAPRTAQGPLRDVEDEVFEARVCLVIDVGQGVPHRWCAWGCARRCGGSSGPR